MNSIEHSMRKLGAPATGMAILICLAAYAASYSFVDADWPNYLDFNNYLTKEGMSGFLRHTFWNDFIIDRRSFFLSWWYQGVAIRAFGINANAFKGELLALMAAFSVSLYAMAVTFDFSRQARWLFVLFMVSAPPITEVILSSNNWFFLIPLVFVNLNLCAVVSFLRKGDEVPSNATCFMLFLSTVVSSFAGEQYLIANILILMSGFAFNYRFGAKFVLVAIAGAAVELSYLVVQPKHFQGVRPWHNLQELVGICANYYYHLFGNITTYYGVNAKNGFAWNFNYAAFLVMAAFAYAGYRAAVSGPTERRVVLVAWLGVLLLLMWGPFTGARPVPEGRYLFGAVYFLAVLFFLQHKERTAMLSVLIAYQLVVTSSVVQTWVMQQRIDRKIDEKLVATLDKSKKNYLLFLNNSKSFTPLSPRSHAPSNYSADYGVVSHLKFLYGLDVTLLRDVEKDNRALSYYGEKQLDISDGVLTILSIDDGPPPTFSEANLFKVGRNPEPPPGYQLKIVQKESYLARKDQYLQIKEWYVRQKSGTRPIYGSPAQTH